MKILMPVIGSRGDIQPFIALAQTLTRAGFHVTLASHPHMRALTESYALGFAAIGPDIDMSEETLRIRQQTGNDLAVLNKIMQLAFKILEDSHEDILQLAQKADLLGISAQSAAGKNEADLVGLPYFSVTFMPWAIRYDDPSRHLVRRFAYGLIDSFASLMTTRPLNRMRKKLALPPIGPGGFASTSLDLIPISPHVFAPIPHWAAYHHMTGFWFASQPADWQPSQELLGYLAAGQPPILVTFGSLAAAQADDQETARMFVEVFAQAGLRTIIQGWSAALDHIDHSADVFPAGFIPHDWLLPQCQAVIHHGGFGTTAAGLKAGIPALIIPHLADQFYWAQYVHELGVSPLPISRKKLDSDSLSSAVNQLSNDPTLAARSARLGEQIRLENGLQTALELISNTFR